MFNGIEISPAPAPSGRDWAAMTDDRLIDALEAEIEEYAGHAAALHVVVEAMAGYIRELETQNAQLERELLRERGVNYDPWAEEELDHQLRIGMTEWVDSAPDDCPF